MIGRGFSLQASEVEAESYGLMPIYLGSSLIDRWLPKTIQRGGLFVC